MADPKEVARFPHLRIEGGPTAESVKIFRDGKELRSVLEFQINGGVDAPMTATFREIIIFDGAIDIMPERKVDTTH
jgi:hypothetical protein